MLGRFEVRYAFSYGIAFGELIFRLGYWRHGDRVRWLDLLGGFNPNGIARSYPLHKRQGFLDQ